MSGATVTRARSAATGGGTAIVKQGSWGTNLGASATLDFGGQAATKMLIGVVNVAFTLTVLSPDPGGGSFAIVEVTNTSGLSTITVSDGTITQPVTIAPSGLTRIEIRCPDATNIDPVVLGGSGMPNPMTAAGDVIVGGVSGAPARFAKGADGTVLGFSGGTLAALTALLAANNGSDVPDAVAFRANLKNQVLGHARAVATTNVASLSGTTTIDGVALVAGDPVLLTGQTTGSQNGPWLVASGAWTRPSDYATGLQFTSRLVPVTGGTTTANQGVWQLKSNALITVGTTATTWANIGGTGSAWTRSQTDPLYMPQWPNLVAPPGLGVPGSWGTAAVMGALGPRGCRVVVPKSGTLHDISWFVGTTSGNMAALVYDTNDASAGNRTLLYTSGSVAVGGTNSWQSVDPSLAVTAGQQLDFLIMADNATATFIRFGGSAGVQTLPTAFNVVPGGASPKLFFTYPTVASLATPTVGSTVAEANVTVLASPPVVIARVS